MSEMVERVAWAMMVAEETPDTGPVLPWEKQSRFTRDKFLRDARAAIAAMREPTPAMLVAGTEFEGDGWGWLSKCWEAMIDTALSGG